MLIRDEHIGSLKVEDMEYLSRIWRSAVRVRFKLEGHVQWCRVRGLWFAPMCHEIAHAFAQVFGGTPVDGEHMFAKTTLFEADGTPVAEFSSLLHSWVEIETPSGARFILDIYPDADGPLFPVLLRYPNAAYWIPTDSARRKAMLPIRRALFQRKVRLLAEAMREIAARDGFPSLDAD